MANLQDTASRRFITASDMVSDVTEALHAWWNAEPGEAKAAWGKYTVARRKVVDLVIKGLEAQEEMSEMSRCMVCTRTYIPGRWKWSAWYCHPCVAKGVTPENADDHRIAQRDRDQPVQQIGTDTEPLRPGEQGRD